MIGWYTPSFIHLTPNTPSTIMNAQAIPPTITLSFQGDLIANKDPAGQKINMGSMYSGR